MKTAIFSLFAFIFSGNFVYGQFSCSDSLIYLDGSGPAPTPFIKVYNPKLPLSANNPSNTNIPSISGGLTLMPNINGGFPSPTLYSTQNNMYCYWNGTTWISTGHQASSPNIGGCGSAIFSLGGPLFAIYKYTGTGPAVPLFTLNTAPVADIATDCDCNFYLLDANGLKKYDLNGTLIATYSITGGGPSYGPGFAIVGNSVYLFQSSFGSTSLSVGTMIGSTITFTLLTGNIGFNPGDVASCPMSAINSIQASISSGSLGCNPSTVSIVATTTSSPVAYNWSGPGLTSPVNNGSIVAVNASGTYTCVITEGNCMYDLATVVTTIVNNAAPPTPSIMPCNYLCISPNQQLFSSLNTTLFTNQWSGGSIITGGNTPTVSIGSTGVYSLSVTSLANGCTGSATATLLPVPIVSLSLSTNTLCVFSQNSPNEIVLNSAGAVHYTLLANPGFSFNTVLSQPVSLYMTPPYAVGGIVSTATLIGSNGVCTGSTTAGFNVLPVTKISVSSTASLVCLGKSTRISASGAITYTWLPKEGLSIYNDSTLVALISGPSIYSVTGTDKFGCKTFEEKIMLDLLPPHRGALTNTSPFYCVPFSSNFKFIPDELTGNPIRSEWAVNNTDYSTKPFYYHFESAGIYTINIKLTDSLNECSNIVNYFIQAYPNPVADFSFLPETPTDLLEEVVFTANRSDPSIIKFNWFFINNNGYKASQERTFYTFEKEGTYPVALVVFNSWGCSDTVVKVVEVNEGFNFFVPNAFTPNGDEKNDTFLPITSGLKTYYLKIFDRWGELLFESNELEHGWNGTFKNRPCKDDTYTWRIELSTIKGEQKILTGSVSLLH